MSGRLTVRCLRLQWHIDINSTLLLYRNYFTDDGWLRAGLAGAAQVVAAAGLGAAFASIVTPIVVRRWSVRGWLVTLFTAAATVHLILGLPYRMAPLLAAAAVLGAVAQGATICVEAVVQHQVSDALRGRVFTLYDTLFNACFVAAALVAAATLPDTGKSYPMLAVVAAGYAAAALGYAWAVPPQRRYAQQPNPVRVWTVLTRLPAWLLLATRNWVTARSD